MDTGKYQGVILAAGQGSRMGPFGDYLPKPIVPICNKPLLEYHLDHMRRIGIQEVFVVIGHLGHRITEVLGDGSRFGLHIEYVEQQEQLGLAHALGQLEPYVDRPFLLTLGDIFFEVSDLAAMVREMEQQDVAAVLAVKEETDAEAVKRNFAVLLREDGTVRRVIEKPRHVPNLLKGCGLYLFDLPIFEAIRRTPRTAMRDEYELTDSIQILIDYEYQVRTAQVVEWDMNITYTHDLIDCCVHQLNKLGKRFLVGGDSTLVDGVELVDTVVGDCVTISRPVVLRRCVVLSKVALDDGKDYEETVITNHEKMNAARTGMAGVAS